MRIAFFTHSLRSDWNHGNAHFLRGLVTELALRGHDVTAHEPADSWSATHLVEAHGESALEGFRAVYPRLAVSVYDPAGLDLASLLDGVDLAIVHEWNEPSLVAAIGLERKRNPSLRVLFHDTHHRSVTDPSSMARYDLQHYDGVLAFGESVRARYLEKGWATRVWTFHEAADTRVFHPRESAEVLGDLVWIGNWGDGEREAELREFLIEPVRSLQLRAQVYGVRYPDRALAALEDASIAYGDFLPNYLAPALFAKYRFTVQIPRRPYTEALPGVPTIRVFEALACGIPLISAPWRDSEKLFPDGSFFKAESGAEMREIMRALVDNPELGRATAAQGLDAILSRHTCGHRATQLLSIASSIRTSHSEVAA